MSSSIRVLHQTEYVYDRPVVLNPHRLMLRPRDAHDLWLDDAFLTITPTANLRWSFDTFGNSIAEATFTGASDRLSIVSELMLRRYATDPRVHESSKHVCPYPFKYTDDETRDLIPYLDLEVPEDASCLDTWLETRFTRRSGESFFVLKSLSDAIHAGFGYLNREEMGTQTASETIKKGVGTCRDFAFFFMEAARRLGFAARFVTGYLNDSGGGADGPVGGGATHAWADAFVPGEGWIEFDPTNRISSGSALIRIATTRKPSQASPVSGSFRAEGAQCLSLDVAVEVSEVETTV